jgi:hypothetical protein
MDKEATGPVVMIIVGLGRITTAGDTADDTDDTTIEMDDLTLVTRLVAFDTIAEASLEAADLILVALLEAADLMLVALLVATELILVAMLVVLWTRAEASLEATDFTLSALLEAAAPAVLKSTRYFLLGVKVLTRGKSACYR